MLQRRIKPQRIVAYDKQINSFLKIQINTDPTKKFCTDGKSPKRVNKNAINGIDLNQTAYTFLYIHPGKEWIKI